MAPHSKVAVLIAFIGLVGIGTWKIAEPYIAEAVQEDVSDAGVNGTIKIGVDGWVGYYPLCSKEIKRRLNRDGYGLRCIDDMADYEDRYKKLKRDDYDFAVGTVDSYVLNGEDVNYPGPIIAVVDESKGGDAIVARKSKIGNLDALKQEALLNVAFTKNSPSHHLLKSVASHFDVGAFKNPDNFIHADGSSSALDSLKAGKSDVAILWEPDVSRAIADDDFVRLLGTEDTQRLIVDVLIASQDTVKDRPEMVRALLKAYFATLKFYRNNPTELVDDISRHYRESDKVASSLLKGVAWASLSENAEFWFDVSNTADSDQGLVDSIDSVVTILLDNKDFKRNPLPNEDSYGLINSSYIEEMYKKYAHAGGFVTPGAQTSGKAILFEALSDRQWEGLREIGSLKSRDILFSSGTEVLAREGKVELDQLMEDLEHYPNFRVEIRGHSGIRGDTSANQMLSEDRADSVLRYLDITYSFDDNRIRAVGFGGTKPLKRAPGESNRAYNYRLPRVEIALLRDEI